MIIPGSSFVSFIFNLCQHCEAGQRDNIAQAFSQTHQSFPSFFGFPYFHIFVLGGISGIYDLVNKSCLKQKKNIQEMKLTLPLFYLMAVPCE